MVQVLPRFVTTTTRSNHDNIADGVMIWTVA